MKNIKKITILLCFLSLVAFVSCSAEDKTGVNNPNPEDNTEIANETGGSGVTEGTGGGGSGSGSGSGSGESGSGESGSGSGSGSGESGSGTGESGGSGETGGTGETTEIGNFPPPEGTYFEENPYFKPQAEVSTEGGKTRIKGRAQWSGNNKAGTEGFDFEISKWKKTTKDGKTTLEAVAESINNVDKKSKNKNAVIIYYSDIQTLKITFNFDRDGSENYEGKFEGPKIK